MATYYAGGATAFAAKQAKGSISGGGERIVHSVFTIGTDNSSTLANGDILQMIKVPAGAKVIDLQLTTIELDTNVSPTLTVEVGDGDDPNRYMIVAAAGIFSTGGTIRLGQGITAPTATTPVYTYTADDTIDVKLTAAIATAATTGFIHLVATYTFDTV